MSTDRALLELAAKAAGIVGEYECWTGQGFMEGIRRKGDPKEFKIWNPLIYDDQALRLAAALRIDIGYEKQAADHPWTVIADGGVEETDECQDIFKATRRAIVRAAAEIGRAMT